LSTVFVATPGDNGVDKDDKDNVVAIVMGVVVITHLPPLIVIGGGPEGQPLRHRCPGPDNRRHPEEEEEARLH
jgi:hypothetical protein